MCFRWVPKLMTLGDLERSYGRHYVLFHTIRQLTEPTASKSLQLQIHVSDKMQPRWSSVVFGNRLLCGLSRTTRAVSAIAELLVYFLCHRTTVLTGVAIHSGVEIFQGGLCGRGCNPPPSRLQLKLQLCDLLCICSITKPTISQVGFAFMGVLLPDIEIGVQTYQFQCMLYQLKTTLSVHVVFVVGALVQRHGQSI